MDPVSIFSTVTFFALSNLVEKQGEYIKSLQDDNVYMTQEIDILSTKNEQLEGRVAELENNFNKLFEEYLRLGSSHAAISARDTVRFEALKEAIDNIVQQVNNTRDKTLYLEEKIDIYHP